VDHYLGVPFDLSEVLFIATANFIQNIPGPLLDRMEVVDFAGYTEREKGEIARKYLIPRQFVENGVNAEQLTITDEALAEVITSYTRESGVRQLEREIGTLCRKVARQVAEGSLTRKQTITEPRVREALGKRRFFAEARRRTKEPGVATGLAWTPAGGEVLFIEASRMAGTGSLTLTGQLGDVMKESARAALSWLRAHAKEYGLDPDRVGAWGASAGGHLVALLAADEFGVGSIGRGVVLAGFGVAGGRGIAYGIVLQAVEVVTAVALGLPALAREGLSWAQLRRTTAAAE
jgi:ATP-dependent Lon protease